MIAAGVFWGSVALMAYAYVGYPCALVLLARFKAREVMRARVTPRVSFIIAAHNEEHRIREKIENTLNQHYPVELLEIIVASDCCTDRTEDIAAACSDRVRVVRTAERRGKEAAQQLALEVAGGEILVFSDVATALAPDGVSTIVGNFADPEVGCVSSTDRFVDPDGRVSGEGLYVGYEMWLRSLETRANSLVGLSGSFFAARREVCRAWRSDRQSDFSTLLNAIDMNMRGVLDPESVGYYRNIVDGRREFDRKVRTVVRGIAVIASNVRMLNPLRHGIFTWQLVSHKLCRWLVPFGMIGAFLSDGMLASQSVFYRTAFVLQVAFYLSALGGLMTRSSRLRIPAFFFLANLSVLAAWIRFGAGERFTVWNPSDRLTAVPHTRSHFRLFGSCQASQDGNPWW